MNSVGVEGFLIQWLKFHLLKEMEITWVMGRIFFYSNRIGIM